VISRLTAEDLARVNDSIRKTLEGMVKAAADAAESLQPFIDNLREAGLLDEEPPTDPKARALWMKQRRNTGPTTPKNWRKR
jgi:hypothetical protein